MSNGGNSVLLFNIFGNFQRVLTGAASRAVGYAHKGGAQLSNLLRGMFYALKGGVCFWGENLKGEG